MSNGMIGEPYDWYCEDFYRILYPEITYDDDEEEEVDDDDLDDEEYFKRFFEWLKNTDVMIED